MNRVLVVIALAALISAPEALAKESGPVEVCGLTQCVTVEDTTQARVRVSPDLLDVAAAPAAPSPYYVLRIAGFPITVGYWIPSAGLLRLGQLTSRWVATRPAETAALALATVGMAPRPAPQTAVTAVDFKPARGGRTYLQLYTIGTPTAIWPGTGRWLRVFVVGAMTPWTDGANSLWVSKRGAFLRRDGMTVRIPASTASRIRQGLPLG